MTYHIHIGGLVQGVGFRPYVYRLAQHMGIHGWVNNTYDGVHIIITAEEDLAEKFYHEITGHPPSNAIITKKKMEEIPACEFSDFHIIHSEHHHQPGIMVTPDFGICPQCRSELNDPGNPRFQYPFITCTHCGPRYSIIRQLPYDREHTTMDPYTMCWRCKEEYHDPKNRRYFSQTNSCAQCGIPMTVHNAEGECICDDYECILTIVNESLQDGKIVAVKGIGGYLLMADAANRMTIATLRERKHRPGKPFAVIYPSLPAAEIDVQMNTLEKDQLSGPAAPIVLCRLKEQNNHSICHDLIAPGLQKIGVMLPYTPLLELITCRFGKPLIATSGNISGSPILYNDDDALEQLTGIADLFLVYERDIVVPQDDSVMQFSPVYHQPIINRRSRGFAPNYYPHPFTLSGSWMAAGAELKSTFALLNGEHCYVSQFLGNQEYFEGQLAYKETLRHLCDMLKFTPDYILSDSHPGYMVSQEAQQMAQEKGIPCISVQHHKAHFAAVLAENGLMETGEPVLGIIWDGTGFGEDGQIWGSECFLYAGNEMQRIAHLEYFPSWLGDKMSREPRISAVAISENPEIHKDKFTEAQWQYYRKLLRNKPEAMTSSMGRFLDGISSILGICHHNTYEGEAAMKLEAEAMKYVDTPTDTYNVRIDLPGREKETESTPLKIGWKMMISEILDDINHQKDRGYIAYKVHCTLARIIRTLAEIHQVRNIAFSGGVFQNALLTDLVIRELGKDHRLYFHRQLSPNDECISFGQIAYVNIEHLSTANRQPSTTNRQQSTVNRQPTTHNPQPNVFSHTR